MMFQHVGKAGCLLYFALLCSIQGFWFPVPDVHADTVCIIVDVWNTRFIEGELHLLWDILCTAFECAFLGQRISSRTHRTGEQQSDTLLLYPFGLVLHMNNHTKRCSLILSPRYFKSNCIPRLQVVFTRFDTP
jgi:hypothetical protein